MPLRWVMTILSWHQCLGRLLSTQRAALGQDDEPSWPLRQAATTRGFLRRFSISMQSSALAPVSHSLMHRLGLQSASPLDFMGKMLAGLALQFEGQTRLSGADVSPGARWAADYCKYLVGGLARSCVNSWHVRFSSSFCGLWVRLKLEASNHGRSKRWQAGRQSERCTPQ